MDWKHFENRFHKTWHASVKKWFESASCDKVYAFLKSQKGKELAPKSNLTFRTFEQPLNEIKVVVLLEEPYCEKHGDVQFADGIPLSCDYVDKLHPHLDEFYNALEREFYDLNLNLIKNKHLNFHTNQGVLFLSSSLTCEIGKPGSHKDLWVDFIGMLIKNVFRKRNIPIIFCGQGLYNRYLPHLDSSYPSFCIKQPLSSWTIGTEWATDGKFTQVNKYLYDDTKEEEVFWVNQDVPY